MLEEVIAEWQPPNKRPVRLGSIPHAIRSAASEQRHGNPSGTRDRGKYRNGQGNSQLDREEHRAVRIPNPVLISDDGQIIAGQGRF
jgi:hypothetical protein